MRKRDLSWVWLWLAIGCSTHGPAGLTAGDGAGTTAGTSPTAGASAGAGGAGAMSGASGGAAGMTILSGNGGVSGSAGASGASGTGGASGAGAASGASGGTGIVIGNECELNGMLIPDGESIPAADGCNTCRCSNRQLACTRIACPPSDVDDCVVAEKLDVCCAQFVAMKRTEVEQSPCLLELGAPAGEKRIDCFPDFCAAVLCAPETPPSRIARPADAANGCAFADECQGAQDCVRASNFNQCCACAESMPRALAERQPCLFMEGDTSFDPAACTGCTTDVFCGMCEPPTEPGCQIRDSFSICQ